MIDQFTSIDARLKKHPHLRARMELILDIAEGKSQGPDTADEIEERTITEIRKLGQEVVTDWAKDKASREISSYRKNHPQARPNKKKESIGTPPLAQSK